MNKLSIQYDGERYTESQRKQIEKALVFAAQAHGTQARASGEPFIIHPVTVAEIVASWGMDHEAVMAALLHDVVEDTNVALEDIEKQFGPAVAALVDGVTKLRLSRTPRPAADSLRLAASNENLRKMLLASTKDWRVLFIKLADRLHNMRTLEYLPADVRDRIARESLQVYAPLADRLGMGRLKGELEDLGFKYIKPEEYVDLERQVRISAKKANRYLAVLKRAISDHLAKADVKVLAIEARQKRYYSIYKKLAKVGGDFDKVYDFIAVRIIVPDVPSCYQTLGILHQHYKPLIYRIKDYIAVPKPNGYQSLHTTVFAEDGHITEIQIRTPGMHLEAENGLAAHFYYDAQKVKGGYAKGRASQVPEKLKWVNELSDLIQRARGGQDIEEVKLDLFGDRIFVFSPKGDLYELPDRATPLDFAFAVHSKLGVRALGARVNGRMTTLDHKLENRDVVEIIARKEPAPSRDWLNFVVTSHAKSRIKAWFREQNRESNVASGRVLLEAELRAWDVKKFEDLPKRAVAQALDILNMKSAEDLLAAVGEGSLSASQVIRRLIPDAAKPKGARVIKRSEPTGRILVEGEQLPYSVAMCCAPVFPQPLLGYVTRGSGVTVHALGCRNIPADAERYATCRWETEAEVPELLICRLELIAADRVGLLKDATALVAEQNLNIGNISSSPMNEGESRVIFSVEVPDVFALSELIKKLERISGIREVRRIG